MKAFPAFAALFTATVLIVPTVSQAATASSVTVSYADLNLASGAGASVLEKRIESAARTVCEIEDSKQLGLAQATSACRDLAIAGAQPQFTAALAAARKPSVTLLPATIRVTAQ